MSLYRVAINFTFQGQAMCNVLWYRDANLIPLAIDVPTAQQQLAEAVRDEVVLGGVVGETRLANILPTAVTLDDVTAQRIDANSYLPEVSAPSVANIGLPALASGTPAASPVCAIMKLVCVAKTITPTDYTPAGGYLAIGPLLSAWVGNDNEIAGGALDSFQGFGASLVKTLDMGAGFLAKPIRVGKGKNGLGITVRGFNDIQNASVRNRWSFRRSRIAE